MYRLFKITAILAALLLCILVASAKASAQPPTYLPWQAGTNYSVVQGNSGSYSHNTAYTRYGWDFGMPYGASALSAAPGRVAVASYGYNNGWGNVVIVCYGDGSCSRYGHLSSVAVSAGQSVGQGQLVGRVGSTGKSTGPHLHYQLENGSGISQPSRFAEAGVPGTGARVTSQNQPGSGDTRPVFDDVRVYAGNVVGVTAGDTVKASVTARYRGPSAIPCGHANLGTRNNAPARFADYSAGYWPASPWRSPNRVAAVGCQGNLDPGEYAHWNLSFKVRANVTPGQYLTGTYAPVHEGYAFSALEIPISLQVASRYQAAWVNQSYLSGAVSRGERATLKVTYRNTGRETLYRDGANPVHLRGIRPDNRRSGFLDTSSPLVVGSGQGVKMDQASVAPGGQFSFTLPVKVADWVPSGDYREYFRPVAEGKDWFGPTDVYWPVTVR